MVVTGQLIGVEEALQKLQGIRRSVQRRICRKGVRSAVQLAVKRGKPFVPKGDNQLLWKSLGWRLLKGANGQVGPRTEVFKRVIRGRVVDPGKYGYIVEGGSQPHAIRPKRAPRLAFRNASGRLVVVKSVRHPGARGRHFLGRIQRTNMSGMATAFASTVERELLVEAVKSRPSETPDG